MARTTTTSCRAWGTSLASPSTPLGPLAAAEAVRLFSQVCFALIKAQRRCKGDRACRVVRAAGLGGGSGSGSGAAVSGAALRGSTSMRVRQAVTQFLDQVSPLFPFLFRFCTVLHRSVVRPAHYLVAWPQAQTSMPSPNRKQVPSASLSFIASGAEAVSQRYLRPAILRVGPRLSRVFSGVASPNPSPHPAPPPQPQQQQRPASPDGGAASPEAEEAGGGGRRAAGNARGAAAQPQPQQLLLRREVVGPGNAPLMMSVTVAAAGLGVSCVSDVEEVAFLHLGGLQAGLTVSSVQVSALSRRSCTAFITKLAASAPRLAGRVQPRSPKRHARKCPSQAAFHVTVGQLRLDNCLLDATHPTALCCPVTYTLFGPPQPVLPPASTPWGPHGGFEGFAAMQALNPSPSSQPSPLPAARAPSLLQPAAGGASAASAQTLGWGFAWAGRQPGGRSAGGMQRSASALIPALPGAATTTGGGGGAAAAPAAASGRQGGGGGGGGGGAAGALTVDACYWLNQPGGVLCVQHVSVQLSPLALDLEEAHMRLLFSYAQVSPRLGLWCCGTDGIPSPRMHARRGSRGSLWAWVLVRGGGVSSNP